MRYKLYHISLNSQLSELTPRIPEQAELGFEDTTIPRICCCSSIDKCLVAMCGVMYDYTYHIYELLIDKNSVIYTPKKVAKYVEDAPYTKEHWCLNSVKVKRIGSIIIDYEGDNYYNDIFAGWINIKWHWKDVVTK